MTPAGLVVLLLLLHPPAQDPEVLSQQALAMAQQKNFAEAERLWKRALELSPRLFSAAFNLGYMYQSQGQYSKAEPWLTRAAGEEPNDFNARYLLGVTLSHLGQTDAALRQWRAALAIRPDHVKLMQVMAVEYGKGGYFREAAAVAERAFAQNDNDPALYLIALKAHQDANDHAEALKLAAQMVRKFPSLPRANFEYAYELTRAGRPAEGLPYLKNAMASDATWEEPFFFYGETLLKEGRTDEAIAALRRAIELRRDYMAAWVALGRALIAAGRLDEAKKELLRATAINPQHPQPHLLLSQLYFRLGDEDLAAKEKQLSLKLRRENPEAMESQPSRPFRP
jgi:tetratricopeptide (TPR) repeat protein